MKLLSWLVYVPLQIVALPLAIVGASLVAYRQLIVSRRLGVSQTAIEILNGRWTLHVFGLRDDPGAAQARTRAPQHVHVGSVARPLPAVGQGQDRR